MPHQTSKEGVTCIFDSEGELIAIIYKNMKIRSNVFYSCNPMSMEELEEMIGSDKIKSNEL